MTASRESSPLTIKDLRGSTGRRRRELIIRSLFFMSAATAVLISILIVVALIGQAVLFITKVDLSSLVSGSWQPRAGNFDLAAIIAGTFVIASIAMLVAAPLGLGAAIFLAEYARPRVRRTIKPILEVLAAIPSVVLGFFTLTVLTPRVVDVICPGPTPIFNMAGAGIAVGILITPLVASIAEDSMYAVPNSLREASYGLGARRRVTSLKVVVPSAVSGITAALIVGFSRAVGETMIVALAAGGVGGAIFNLNPCMPGQTMTAAMTALAVGSDQAGGGIAYSSLFFVGLLLFVMTLTLNLISERFVRRLRSAY
ncbi:MAG TPA: phosphate ABC transporter permease subunit PstC [Candidatus Limnocylindrales bacterium]|nr:phosphate ABC transporter permease subunit PstC [Candidatus Limnocylindrales bacterium]